MLKAQNPLFGPLGTEERGLTVRHREVLQALRLLVEAPGGAHGRARTRCERGVEARAPARNAGVIMTFPAYPWFNDER